MPGITCSRFAGQGLSELGVAASDYVLRGFQGSPLDDALRTMARMAFLSASGSVGQALTKRVRAGSVVAGVSGAPGGPESGPPCLESCVFFGGNALSSRPVPATLLGRS